MDDTVSYDKIYGILPLIELAFVQKSASNLERTSTLGTNQSFDVLFPSQDFT